MAVRDILLLGDPRLYEPSEPVREDEIDAILPVIADLQDTMLAFQERHGWGRAIAAVQIGVHKRIVCMNDGRPLAFLNPVLDDQSKERLTYWEDCMSFPELLVQLSIPRRCRLTYRDTDWNEHQFVAEDDYAGLIQHEVDHLDGILSVQRVLDDRSIALRRSRPEKDLALRGVFQAV